MNYDVKAIPSFDKSVKALIKKYPSFKSDLVLLKKLLLENPQAGTPIGNSCYKIRLSITGKNKGKSGGARVITHLMFLDHTKRIIYLLAIYDKSEQGNITDNQIKELLKLIK